MLLFEETEKSWDSIKEATPGIVLLWKSWCENNSFSFSSLNCGQFEVEQIIDRCLAADLVVIASHTSKCLRIIPAMRVRDAHKPQFGVYLFGMASVACWPLIMGKICSSLTNLDFFIGTCEADLRCMQLSFQNARTLKIPFQLIPLEPPTQNLKQNQDQLLHFVYIGRVSSQKNIHSLIWALSLLKKQSNWPKWVFDIYGAEDGYGSPNVGVSDQDYLETLKNLTASLGLENRVRFHGWKSRESIFQQISPSNSVVVSASLHADENFGLAVYRSLRAGFRAILSNWGGHQDLIKNFPAATQAVPVLESGSGPFIPVSSLVTALKNSLSLWLEKKKMLAELSSDEDPRINSEDIFIDSSKVFKAEPLLPSKFALEIVENRLKFNSSGSPKQIFADYSDPLIKPWLHAYGAVPGPAQESPSDFLKSRSSHDLAPWVSWVVGANSQHCIEVKDPLLGAKTLPVNGPAASGQGQIDLENLRLLEKSGWIHVEQT